MLSLMGRLLNQPAKLALKPACVLLLLLSSYYCYGQEYSLKAAYLANIAKFVSWPNAEKQVDLCIGEQSQLHELGGSINHFKLDQTRYIHLKNLDSDMETCEIIFLDRSIPPEKIAEIRSSDLPDSLIVSDLRKGINQGDAIQLYIRDLKLRIAINETAINQANYKVSSKLLRLSRRLN